MLASNPNGHSIFRSSYRHDSSRKRPKMYSAKKHVSNRICRTFTRFVFFIPLQIVELTEYEIRFLRDHVFRFKPKKASWKRRCFLCFGYYRHAGVVVAREEPREDHQESRVFTSKSVFVQYLITTTKKPEPKWQHCRISGAQKTKVFATKSRLFSLSFVLFSRWFIDAESPGVLFSSHK